MRRLLLLAILATSPGCLLCSKVDKAFGHPPEDRAIEVVSCRLTPTSSGAELEVVTREVDGTLHESTFAFESSAPLATTKVVPVWGRGVPSDEHAALLLLERRDSGCPFALHLPPRDGWCEHVTERLPAEYPASPPRWSFEGADPGPGLKLTALSLTGDATGRYVPHLRGRAGEKDVALVGDAQCSLAPEEGALPRNEVKVFVTTDPWCRGLGGYARRVAADGSLTEQWPLSLEDCLSGVLVDVEQGEERLRVRIHPPCAAPNETSSLRFNAPTGPPACAGTIAKPSHIGTKVAFCLLIVPAAIFDVATFPIQIVIVFIDGLNINVVGFG